MTVAPICDVRGDMPTRIEDVVRGVEQLNGIASLSDIYQQVRNIRPPPHPQSFEAIIRGEIESHSSDSQKYAERGDLFYSVEGLGSGVWGLRHSLKSTPVAVDVGLPPGEVVPGRELQATYRILRDTALARQIKLLHKNKCQLCGMGIDLPDGKIYSEAHHIKPLGIPHNGPDIAENIIILCPNHHAMLDYGAIPLKTEEIRTHPRHFIAKGYVEFHNQIIFGCSTQ